MKYHELNWLIFLLAVLIFGMHMDDLYCDSFSPGSIDDPVLGPCKPQDPNDHANGGKHTKGVNDHAHQHQKADGTWVNN